MQFEVVAVNDVGTSTQATISSESGGCPARWCEGVCLNVSLNDDASLIFFDWTGLDTSWVDAIYVTHPFQGQASLIGTGNVVLRPEQVDLRDETVLTLEFCSWAGCQPVPAFAFQVNNAIRVWGDAQPAVDNAEPDPFGR